MASDQLIDSKFTWGDPVKVCPNSPAKYVWVEKGSICGIRQIETKKVSKLFNESIGTILYLVEASNGASIEVPEQYLIAL